MELTSTQVEIEKKIRDKLMYLYDRPDIDDPDKKDEATMRDHMKIVTFLIQFQKDHPKEYLGCYLYHAASSSSIGDAPISVFDIDGRIESFFATL